jgi:putative NADH-flavin reductase
MTKIVVFGAAGGTGRQIVSQALEQGHDVTAFVRGPGKIGIQHQRLREVFGDAANDAPSVMRALPGHDVVISALGVGKSFAPNGLIETSMRNVVTAMESVGVRRLVWQSAFGVGGTRRDAPLLAKVFMATLLRRIYADKRAAENYLRQRDLDWTLVCPTMLTDALGTGTYRSGERLDLRGMPTISRADVARFMLTQLDDQTYLHKEVLVSS